VDTNRLAGSLSPGGSSARVFPDNVSRTASPFSYIVARKRRSHHEFWLKAHSRALHR
jgi:hypothetical protein